MNTGGVNPYVRAEKFAEEARVDKEIIKILLLERIAETLETFVNLLEIEKGLEQSSFVNESSELIRKYKPKKKEEI